MITFNRLTLEDIEIIRPFLKQMQHRTCDYTIGGIFMWRDRYEMEYSLFDGALFVRLFYDGQTYYNVPLGGDLQQNIKTLFDIEGDRIRLCTIPEEFIASISGLGLQIKCEAQTDYFDYLYNKEDLLYLKGKKYSAQRNLISQFKRNNPDYATEIIDQSNIGEVINYLKSEYRVGENVSENELEEYLKTLEVLENYNKYAFSGLTLKSENKLIGFSVGEIKDDTLFVHIEKSNRSIKGAYQTLTNEFLKAFANEEILYVNREEDMGDEGLRKAKLAYHPVCHLKKFEVELTK